MAMDRLAIILLLAVLFIIVLALAFGCEAPYEPKHMKWTVENCGEKFYVYECPLKRALVTEPCDCPEREQEELEK